MTYLNFYQDKQYGYPHPHRDIADIKIKTFLASDMWIQCHYNVPTSSPRISSTQKRKNNSIFPSPNPHSENPLLFVYRLSVDSVQEEKHETRTLFYLSCSSREFGKSLSYRKKNRHVNITSRVRPFKRAAGIFCRQNFICSFFSPFV